MLYGIRIPHELDEAYLVLYEAGFTLSQTQFASFLSFLLTVDHIPNVSTGYMDKEVNENVGIVNVMIKEILKRYGLNEETYISAYQEGWLIIER